MVEDVAALVVEEESIESALEVHCTSTLAWKLMVVSSFRHSPHLRRLIPLHASSLPATVWVNNGVSKLIRSTSRAPHNWRRLSKKASSKASCKVCCSNYVMRMVSYRPQSPMLHRN